MVSDLHFLVQSLVALLLGAAIGLERQLRNHEAGLKTNALVAFGSSLFVLMARHFGEPDRIVAQIMPGIGFLGAGMILRDGLHVRGMNTAATVWCTAAIGTLAGAGEMITASMAAALVLIANIVLRFVVERIDARPCLKCLWGPGRGDQASESLS